MRYPKRGDLFWVALDPTLGSEIQKTQPAVIVSNDIGNECSNIVIVAPIRSNVKEVYSFNVLIKLENIEEKILLNQIRAIDKKRLCNRIGACNAETIRKIDTALKVVLNLN